MTRQWIPQMSRCERSQRSARSLVVRHGIVSAESSPWADSLCKQQGAAPEQVEEKKRAKSSIMVRKCVNAIYNVTSYSYFREDLTDGVSHKCIDPVDVVYARPKNKWDRAVLLVLDQPKIKLPPMAQAVLLEMTRHTDERAFKRWNSMLDSRDSRINMTMERMFPTLRLRGARHCRTLRQRLNGLRDRRLASHQNQGEAGRQDPKGEGKGKKGGKSSKSSKGSQPTWQRTNWTQRSWNNPAASVNAYDATFRDGQWTNLAMRGDHGYWDNHYEEEEEDYEEDTGR